MRTQDGRAVRRRQNLDVISVKRNPYLVDYEEQKRLRRAVNESIQRPSGAPNRRKRTSSGGANGRNRRSVDLIDINSERPHAVPDRRRQNPAAKKAMQKRRKRQRRRRRMIAAAWILCLFMIGWLIVVKKGEASKQNDITQEVLTVQEEEPDIFSGSVQGIPAKVFAKHPMWAEDFLPLNEYSRPGETLPEVRDIFVHYTANPETSAAQNRSYFEQQKDMHEASVSAHFIIGYDGEIIQCVPLDEIAYAVQTRNYDSVSIECCYKVKDGSFTQETYDSLISLLAWLTDVYDLDTSHILRHYDCGGKKCPLYYTEHEDAWMQLKKDVEDAQGSVFLL